MQSHGTKRPCSQKIVRTNKKVISCPQPDEFLRYAHPRVFLSVYKGKTTSCPYCSTQFTLEIKNEQ